MSIILWVYPIEAVSKKGSLNRNSSLRPLITAGLASELKTDTIPCGRGFPAACSWKLKSSSFTPGKFNIAQNNGLCLSCFISSINCLCLPHLTVKKKMFVITIINIYKKSCLYRKIKRISGLQFLLRIEYWRSTHFRDLFFKYSKTIYFEFEANWKRERIILIL